jgi:hypothetical protein
MNTTDIRELSVEELDLVSGGKTVSYHDGFKFTLYDNGDLKISAGGWVGVTNNSQGENIEIRTHI